MKQPILHLEVLAPDGTHATDHVVFCRFQGVSVRVEECCQCVHCDFIGEGLPAAVHCTTPSEPSERPDPDGERTAVGALLCQGTVVVGDGVSFGRALDLLRAGDRRSIAIVDDTHVMVGVVHDAGFAARSRFGQEGAVSVAMTSAIAVDEWLPVRTALELLAANHLREATVVSKRGVPIGVFRDVDGLTWIAAHHGRGEPKMA